MVKSYSIKPVHPSLRPSPITEAESILSLSCFSFSACVRELVLTYLVELRPDRGRIESSRVDSNRFVIKNGFLKNASCLLKGLVFDKKKAWPHGLSAVSAPKHPGAAHVSGSEGGG